MDMLSKVKILMGHIRNEVNLEEQQDLQIQEVLKEGMLRIQEIEQAELAAEEQSFDVPVERVTEGFALWERGGYDTRTGRGSSMLAAGIGGEKLRRIRTVSERNGRHNLVVVYQGCYIAEAKSFGGVHVPMLAVYMITKFIKKESGYFARCVRVYRRDPPLCRVPEGEIAKLAGAAGDVSVTPNMYRLDW